MRKFRAIPFGIIGLTILIGVSLPNTTLSNFRSRHEWFNQTLLTVYAWYPAIDTVHFLLFAAFGFFATIKFPRVQKWKISIWIMLFAAATEIIQWWAPGRRARLSDFGVDIAGAVVGIIIASAVLTIFNAVRNNQAFE